MEFYTRNNKHKTMKYTAVIRTLGRGGKKYQRLLDSLCAQTIKPTEIIVYIANGNELPKETCTREKFIFVKKGMVSQRALPYDEIVTEFILFLDDDVFLPYNAVDSLYNALKESNADIISPDVFDNSARNIKTEILMTLSGRMKARRKDCIWAYKVMSSTGYSYNKKPCNKTYLSQTNAGPCFLCRKEDFLKIHFEDEKWLDTSGYPIGEDQVMYYKMYLAGLKQLTLFGSGIEHLDAGGNLGNKDKELNLIESDYFFRKVFWHRFLQMPERRWTKRLWNRICITYFYSFGFCISALKGDMAAFRAKRRGLVRAKTFLRSDRYKSLPKIEKKV